MDGEGRRKMAEADEYDAEQVARESSLLCRENTKLRKRLKELEEEHGEQMAAMRGSAAGADVVCAETNL